MADFTAVAVLVGIIAVLMTMVGKGGGNFYVVILSLAQVPMHEAAATGQFMLFAAAAAAMVYFHKNRSVVWPLAILIGTSAALAAFCGGYFSHFFNGVTLKIIFAVMLATAGALMLTPISEQSTATPKNGFGIWRLQTDGGVLHINVWIALPTTALTGFASGMVGVSGGSFLVPLMVLFCGVPMHAAVGTASTLIAATAFPGFAGHALQGDFNPSWALPLAGITILGGLMGSRFALKSRPKHLKTLFAYTNWLAALLMAASALGV